MLKKTIIWTGFVVSLLAFGYCALGVIMTAWISATPGEHDLAALEFRAYLWIAATVVFLILSVVLAYFGLKKHPEKTAIKEDRTI
jgi:hypothetical protein